MSCRCDLLRERLCALTWQSSTINTLEILLVETKEDRKSFDVEAQKVKKRLLVLRLLGIP